MICCILCLSLSLSIVYAIETENLKRMNGKPETKTVAKDKTLCMCRLTHKQCSNSDDDEKNEFGSFRGNEQERGEKKIRVFDRRACTVLVVEQPSTGVHDSCTIFLCSLSRAISAHFIRCSF